MKLKRILNIIANLIRKLIGFFKFFYNRKAFAATVSVIVFYFIFRIISNTFTLIDEINELQVSLADLDYTDLSYYFNLKDDFECDTNIVLVDIGNLDREGIAKQINIINKFKPKVIGLDAFFRKPKESKSDSLLESAFAEVDNLVLVSESDKDAKNKSIIVNSHPKFKQHATSGIGSNFFDKDLLVRSFPSFVVFDSSKKEYCFTLQVVRHFDNKKAEKFLKRNKDIEYINFNYQRIFIKIHTNDLFENEHKLQFLKNKIVLIGFIGIYEGSNIIEDIYWTPLAKVNKTKSLRDKLPDMYGVEIQAHIINMMLKEKYIDTFPTTRFGNFLFLIIYMYVFFIFLIHLYKNNRNHYNLVSKLISLGISILLVTLAIFAFAKFDIRINLTLIVLFTLFAPDYYEVHENNIRIWVIKFFKLFRRKEKKIQITEE